MIFSFRYFSSTKAENETANLSNFANCAAAGNPVTESYPRQCTDKTGKTYREPLQSVPSPYEQLETSRGRVTKFDIEVFTQGVDGVIEIETQPEVKFTYYIGNGGSPDCDRSLIKMAQTKEIQVGDVVEIRSKLAGIKPERGEAVDSIGFESVCDEGTYIKKLDPSASSGDNSIQSDFVTVRGNITSLNLGTMDNTGTSGSMVVRSANGETYEIIIFSRRYLDGPSLCGRPELPANLVEKANVEVRGEQHVDPNSSKSLTVCARETFIKLL